jgi:NAD(P)-dependent dehydrogenase (short-subunit alcohol dehydrogenase family)
MSGKVAIIFGVGAVHGLGAALGRKFASEGMNVLLAGRTQEKLDKAAGSIAEGGGKAATAIADVTRPEEVAGAFDAAEKLGELDAVLYNAGNNAIIPFMELTPERFEEFWRVGCLGGFHVGQEAVRRLLPRGHGSILFTGASGSLRGKANFAHFASAKAALRNMVQSMAREFGPQGLHIGHVVIDGVINGEMARSRFQAYLDKLGDDGALEPDAIAEAFWALHEQPRSAWTHELDLRPFKENW